MFPSHDPQLWIAMAYVPGKTVREIIRDRKMSWEEINDLARDVLDVLSKAHSMGVVHRDIKPENIIKSDYYLRYVLIDWGTAFQIDPIDEKFGRLTELQTFSGTPQFAPPEQCKGEEIGTRSDIYALGVTLYELATGRVPYVGASFIELLKHHIESPVKRPSSIVLGMPGKLDNLICAMMQKDPHQRPSAKMSLEALKNDLEFEISEEEIVSVSKIYTFGTYSLELKKELYRIGCRLASPPRS